MGVLRRTTWAERLLGASLHPSRRRKTHRVRCADDARRYNATGAACELDCRRARGCVVAEHLEGGCRILDRPCLHRVPAEKGGLLELRLPSWPRSPRHVRPWRSRVGVVIAAFAADAPSLVARLAPTADVVVYQKVGNASWDAQVATATTRFETLVSRLCPIAPYSCLPTSALAYFATLPNYGHSQRGAYNWWVERRGGGREPHAYLRFVLDFYARLPPVVVFAQDDCSTTGYNACPALTAPPSTWRGTPGFARENCACRWIEERFWTRYNRRLS